MKGISTYFALEVKSIIRDRDLKVKDVEDGVGLSRGYLSKCVKGNKELGLASMLKIEEYFGVDILTKAKENYYNQTVD